VKEVKDWLNDFLCGRIWRREFVERAATGGLSLIATSSLLSTATHGDELRPNPTRGHEFERR